MVTVVFGTGFAPGARAHALRIFVQFSPVGAANPPALERGPQSSTLVVGAAP
jgi:hypothetical protein